MEKLAKMAMLDTMDAQRLWADVDKMLSMVEELKEVEATEDTEYTEGILRADEPSTDCGEGGCIVVPKVVGE